ncbi:hypothetical protein Taro_046894 [Colocasia esculenta]|uniref:Uncharacterized protein n=1 Tax=Colocasia esculenta TaxID=4460 RepID=A0A843X335_COLES|nr:hypothetical protein [Colocasia esculenta]
MWRKMGTEGDGWASMPARRSSAPATVLSFYSEWRPVRPSLLPLSLEFLLLWLVRDWLSLLSLVREAHPSTLFSVSCERELLYGSESRVAFLQVLEVATRPSGSLEGVREVGRYSGIRAQGSNEICNELITMVASFLTGFKCELQESVAAIAGCACYECGCWFARAAVEFIVRLRVHVGVSRRLREPTYGVSFTGAGLWSAEPVEVGVFARAKQMLVCRVALLVEHCYT